MPEDPPARPDEQAPAPAVEVCYRHPNEVTRVHCTRCGRPICPDCMIPAPVGFHCPECVEQARREFRQGPGRAFRGGVSVTKALLVAIVAMFAYEVVTEPRSLMDPTQQHLFELGGLFPPAVADGQYWRLFTAMFLHAGLFHIGFNAYALYLFGTSVESSFGRVQMALIYFVAGFLASAASYAFGPCGFNGCFVGVGASGAIFGIFGAFIAFNYRRRHLALASANLRMAATLLLLNLLLAFGFGGRIDWRAHLGGLVAGVLTGVVAEGWGTPAQRRIIRVGGYAALVVAGIGLVVWRTNDLRQMFLGA
jgi:membrane associated rhomboid family serine protease